MRQFFTALSPTEKIIVAVVMLPIFPVLIVWKLKVWELKVWKLKHLWEHFLGIVVVGYAASWYLITDPSTYAGDYASDVRLYLGACALLIGLNAIMNWRNRRANLGQLSVSLALGAFLLLVRSPEILGFRIIVAAALAWVLEKAAIALATEIWGLPREFPGSEKAGA